MSEADIKSKILEVLEQACPGISEFEGSLLESDLMDSLAIITIVTELEDAFEIEIDPDYITPETFETVDSIAELIEETLEA